MVISNLPVLIAERGLSITKVYEDTGISRTTLTSLVKGKASGVHFDTVNTLCRYLQILPGQLFLFAPFDIDYTKIGDVVPGSVVFMSDTSVSFREKDTFLVVSEWDKGGSSFRLDAGISANFDTSTRTLRAEMAFSLPESEDRTIFLETFSRLPRPFLSRIEHDLALTHAGISEPIQKIKGLCGPKEGASIPVGMDPVKWLDSRMKLKVSYNITWPKEVFLNK